jgi:hypothetical protein
LLREEVVPRPGARLEDSLHGVPYAVAQRLLAQIKSHALHGIELRRVSRQKHQADVLRYTQPPGRVPSRLVKDQHRMRVRGQALREVLEEDADHRSGGKRHHQRERLIGSGPYGPEEIDRGEAFVGGSPRAHALFEPNVGRTAFLPDPGLVLEPELQVFVRVLACDLAYGARQIPPLKAFCSAAFASG